MRVTIYYVDPDTNEEKIENVRYTDEIAENENMTDEEADYMENCLKTNGRFYLNCNATRYCNVTRYCAPA